MLVSAGRIQINPRLFYRLDPGEPGLLRSARASDSVRRVTQQEQRNIRRLEAEALREGRQVITSGITYRFGIDGSFSSIRAGRTEVVSRELPDRQVNPLPDLQQEDATGSADNPTDAQALEPGRDPVLSRLSDTELAGRKQSLEVDRARLQNRKEREGDLSDIDERAIREVEASLDRIEQEETRRILESQQQTVEQALQASGELAGGVIGLIRGGSINIEDVYNGITGQSQANILDISV